MRLFGKVDGTIDRHDRAAILTLPFDLAFFVIAQPPFRSLAGQAFVAGSVTGQSFAAGSKAGQSHTAGSVAGQSYG